MSIIVLLSLLGIVLGCPFYYSVKIERLSYDILRQESRNGTWNCAFSPFATWNLISGIALGATGQSYEQLRRAFGITRNPLQFIAEYKALMANLLATPHESKEGLFSQNHMLVDRNYKLKIDFERISREVFKGTIHRMDFSDPNTNQKFVRRYRKGGQVNNVLTSDVFKQSKVIWINTITFNGTWQYPFQASSTKLEEFYEEDRRAAGWVNMMNLDSELAFSRIEQIHSSVLELPYGDDGKFSMLIMLPFKGVRIVQVCEELRVMTLSKVVAKLQRDVRAKGMANIQIKIPRFRTKSKAIFLDNYLKQMGVVDIFDHSLARFGHVSDSKMFISTILHKADIEVTELGTLHSKKAAYKPTQFKITPTLEMYANRPFFYFVLEKSTSTAIFSGVYSEPSVY